MMDKQIHKQESDRAAAEIEAFMAEYQADFRIRVYGNPPTISLQLSVGAAHHLLSAIRPAASEAK